MNLKQSKLVFYLLIALSGQAQSDLSASDAVFTALENNYEIVISQKQLEITQTNNSWSEAGAFPTVDLSVMNGYSLQDNSNNEAPFTIQGLILNQSITPSLNTNWNIFNGFAVRISKLRLEQLEQQSANNAMAIIENTVQDVPKAYYTAQLQNERKGLFENIMALSRNKVNYYELKEKYSGSNSLELLQFKNQYLTDSTNYLLQKISCENALRNLVLLMNDTTIAIDKMKLTDELDQRLIDADFSNAQEEMLANNQNLKNQYISLELQKTNTSFQRSFLYPTLNFQAGVNPNWATLREIKDSNFEATSNNISYYGNLNLRFSLFNNWKNKRAVEVSKIQEEIGSMNIESMKQTLSSTLKNLISLYKTRAQLADISKENLIYSAKALKLAEDRFNVGSINSIEFSGFQNNYQNTLIQHYENLFNKLDTYLEIYKMTGRIGLKYTN
jgi:outer membrane protein TolC